MKCILLLLFIIAIAFSQETMLDTPQVYLDYPPTVDKLINLGIRINKPIEYDSAFCLPDSLICDTAFFITSPVLSIPETHTEKYIRLRICCRDCDSIYFDKKPFFVNGDSSDFFYCYDSTEAILRWEELSDSGYYFEGTLSYLKRFWGLGMPEGYLFHRIGDLPNGEIIDSVISPYYPICDNIEIHRDGNCWIIEAGLCRIDSLWPSGDPFDVYIIDTHPEELYVMPFHTSGGVYEDKTLFSNTLLYLKAWGSAPKIQYSHFNPRGTIDFLDSIRIDYFCNSIIMGAASELYDCSGGKVFYFLLDSTSAWMTIEWAGGADTIRYGDAGTFWYRPDSLPLPWRRFGVIADSTDIPADYDGEITVCMQDVTNAPVVAYGEPVHLHPRGVDPFMECDGIPHCCPAPPEPVCWSFYVHPTGVAEPQSNNIGKSAMSLKIAGDISADFSIAYNCPENSKLVIYDVLGRAVFQRNVSGVGKINWSEENTRTGVYFAMLKYDGKSVLRKIILVK